MNTEFTVFEFRLSTVKEPTSRDGWWLTIKLQKLYAQIGKNVNWLEAYKPGVSNILEIPMTYTQPFTQQEMTFKLTALLNADKRITHLCCPMYIKYIDAIEALLTINDQFIID